MNSDLQDAVDHYLADTQQWLGGGLISVWLGDLSGEVQVSVEADRAHYAASTMKLPLLVAVHRQAERGLLDLDESVRVRNVFESAFDASTFSLDRSDDQDDETWDLMSQYVSIGRLAERATIYSGNLATNLVLSRVGLNAVNEVLADAGCSSVTMLRRGIEDSAARQAGLDNFVTASDLGVLMRSIADRTIAAAPSCVAIEGILARQHWREGIPAGLGKGIDGQPTYCANKTGWVTDVAHDVGLVRPTAADHYVLVVLTSLSEASIRLAEDEADAVIAALSRTVWDAWQVARGGA